MKKFTTSQRLKQLMNERKIKQIDILKKAEPFCNKYNIKLNKNDLSQYVNGKVEPGQHKLTILGLALNVNEAWLMGYDVPMEKIKIEPEVIEAIKNLNTNIKLSEIPLTVKKIEKIDFANKIDNFDSKKFAESYKKFMETFRPEILEYYNQLNDEGKREATKRVKELTYLPDYKK